MESNERYCKEDVKFQTTDQSVVEAKEEVSKERFIETPVIINLFGGPGCGKSTGAAYIFSQLKLMDFKVELITEFVKDKTWEHNYAALGNQAYLFGEQLYRITRCIGQVDFLVTDSPLLLSEIYNNNPILGEDFNKVVSNVFNSFNNINFLLERVKPYRKLGRFYEENEAQDLDKDSKTLLDKYGIKYQIVPGNLDGYNAIIDCIVGITNGDEESLSKLSKLG